MVKSRIRKDTSFSFTYEGELPIPFLEYTPFSLHHGEIIFNSIGNSMICSVFGINATSDISKLLYVISRAVRRVKFETTLKYHEWYFCQISRTNHALIYLYYYPQKVSNFHM